MVLEKLQKPSVGLPNSRGVPFLPVDHMTRSACRVGCPFGDQRSVGVLPTTTAVRDDTAPEKQYKC